MKKLLIALFILSSMLLANQDTNKSVWKSNKIEKEYKIEYDKNTTCLVRHLKLYKNPEWVAKIEVRNGKVVYFCSPKSMFEFYFRPAKWYEIGVKSERDFSKIIVTDYKTLKPIDAEKAFFVYGSRAISPAGDDLVAFKSKEEAENFVKKEGGSRIFTFDKVPFGLIKLLNNSL